MLNHSSLNGSVLAKEKVEPLIDGSFFYLYNSITLSVH
jgi:hypothetical protein